MKNVDETSVTPGPEYQLPILLAIAERDRVRAKNWRLEDGARTDYSATEFRDRVFEILKPILTKADFEKIPGKEKTTFAWLRMRSQLAQMVRHRNDVGNLLTIVGPPGRKSRYQLTDNGIKYLNSRLGTDYKTQP